MPALTTAGALSESGLKERNHVLGGEFFAAGGHGRVLYAV
jgi:hypothetical protein